MTTKKISIPIEIPDGEDSERAQKRIRNVLSDHVEACSEAAAIWARLHYGHASYVDGSLSVKSVEFQSDTTGKAALSFEWTFQDGCSDTFHEGDGFVEVTFSVLNGQLNLEWAWPEQPSTVDEF
jgi:hypothetical protein